MHISAHLRFSDAFRFNIQLAKSWQNLSGHVTDMVLVFVAAIAWQSYSREPTGASQWFADLPDAFGFSIVYVLAWFVVDPILAAVEALAANSLGDHEFEIGENSFIARNRSGERATLWKNVHSVEVLKDYAMVKVGRCTCHIIPAEAFSSRDDFEKCCIELRRRKSDA